VPLAGFVPAMGDNRIINGDMRIDQRNGGAPGTLGGYTVDRWVYGATQPGKVQSWGQAGGGPTGFGYCLNVTSSSAYTSLAADLFYLTQAIEADMVSDFVWGTANAQPVTLSFWAYSSKTGAFSGAIGNYAQTRSYPFSYNISTASVWTKFGITIPGDTSGTWVMSGNGGSVAVYFDLGGGTTGRAAAGAWRAGAFSGVTGAQSIMNTNGASYGLTGVKLEIGSTATPYNRQSLAKSMADCQRYYQQLGGAVASDMLLQGYGSAGGLAVSSTIGISAMRAAPTATRVGSWTLVNVSTVNLAAGLSTLGIQANATAVGPVTVASVAGTFISLSAEL